MKENAIKEKLVKFIRDTRSQIIKHIDKEDFENTDYVLRVGAYHAELFLDTFNGVCYFSDVQLDEGKMKVWLTDFCNGHGFSAEEIYQQFN